MKETLLPTVGEELMYIGSKFNLTVGRYYRVIRRDYSVISAYAICVLDDVGIETWCELVEFSLLDDSID